MMTFGNFERIRAFRKKKRESVAAPTHVTCEKCGKTFETLDSGTLE